MDYDVNPQKVLEARGMIVHCLALRVVIYTCAKWKIMMCWHLTQCKVNVKQLKESNSELDPEMTGIGSGYNLFWMSLSIDQLH